MGASGRVGVGLALEETALAGELAGEGEDTRDGRGGGEEDGRESNHFEDVDLRLERSAEDGEPEVELTIWEVTMGLYTFHLRCHVCGNLHMSGRPMMVPR